MSGNRKWRKRTRLQRLLERDNYRCGIHLAGCGESLDTKDANIGHIVPKAVLRRPTGYDQLHFDNLGSSVPDCNVQPMHEDCNFKMYSSFPPNPFTCYCKCCRWAFSNDNNEWVSERDVLIYFTREYIHYSHGYESTFIRVPFNIGQMGIGLRDGRLVDYGYTLMTCHRQLHHGAGLHYKVSKQTGGAWLLEDIKRFNRIAAQKPYPDAPSEGAWTPDHKEVVTVDNLLEIFPQRFS